MDSGQDTVIDLNTTSLVIKYAAGDGGDATISNVLSGFKANAEALLAQTQQRTATPLGLIAERLPSARYHIYEGFTLYDFDAVLGIDNTRRYDTQGRNTSDEAGSPEFYRSMSEQFVYSAVERQAIAPMWEVKTAQLQAFNNHYEYDSALRRFYAGKLPKTLVRLAANDESWKALA